jgi:hypothetical protein
MGSYSTTAAANLAPTVQDNEKPVVNAVNAGSRSPVNLGGLLLNGSNRLDSDNYNLSGGSTINTLDGGAINSAFSFAGDAITKLFDLTSKTIEQNKTNTADFMNQVASNSQESLGLVGSLNDDAGNQSNILKMVLIGGAALAGLFLLLKFRK